MRLINASLLTLRRRRGLMAWAAILAVGVPIVVEAILLVLHAHDATSRPAGGADTFTHVASSYDIAVVVMAALIGASAGAGDLAAGTFRDLVATGCPRAALFMARLPAALGVALPLAGAGGAVIISASYLFADGAATPAAAQAMGILGHILVVAFVCVALGLGFGELVGSRGIAIGVLLGWLLAGEQLLVNVSVLGRARELLLGPSLDRLRPLLVDDSRLLPMSALAAVATVVCWSCLAIGLGLARAKTRDA